MMTRDPNSKIQSGCLTARRVDSKNAELFDLAGKSVGRLRIGAKGYCIGSTEAEPAAKKGTQPAALKRKAGIHFLTTRRPDWMRKIEAESVGA